MERMHDVRNSEVVRLMDVFEEIREEKSISIFSECS